MAEGLKFMFGNLAFAPYANVLMNWINLRELVRCHIHKWKNPSDLSTVFIRAHLPFLVYCHFFFSPTQRSTSFSAISTMATFLIFVPLKRRAGDWYLICMRQARPLHTGSFQKGHNEGETIFDHWIIWTKDMLFRRLGIVLNCEKKKSRISDNVTVWK